MLKGSGNKEGVVSAPPWHGVWVQNNLAWEELIPWMASFPGFTVPGQPFDPT